MRSFILLLVGVALVATTSALTAPTVSLVGSSCTSNPLVQSPTTNTAVNCDRDYVFGSDFSSYLNVDSTNTYLLQDYHDPNDHSHASTNGEYVDVTFTTNAEIFLCVPRAEQGNSGHSHVEGQTYPNNIDPAGGWSNTGEMVTQENGIQCQMFQKNVVPGTYTLYHTTEHGWGYVYFMRLTEASIYTTPKVTVVGQSCTDSPLQGPNLHTGDIINCDRTYTWGSGFSDLFAEDPDNTYSLLDYHDPNDFSHSTTQFTDIMFASGAKVSLCVPVGSNSGHSHTSTSYPDQVDPAGGWTDLNQELTLNSGVACKMFAKTFTPGSATLYHTTDLGWGYVYIVQLLGAATAATAQTCTDNGALINLSGGTGGTSGTNEYVKAGVATVTMNKNVYTNGMFYYMSNLFDGSNSCDTSTCSDRDRPTTERAHNCYMLMDGSGTGTITVDFDTPTAIGSLNIQPNYRDDSYLTSMTVTVDGVNVAPSGMASLLTSSKADMGWQSSWSQDGGTCTTIPEITVPITQTTLVSQVVISFTSSGHLGMGELQFFQPGASSVRAIVDGILA